MAEIKVWFITGASSGFGREIARRALSEGDVVVVTARDTQALDGLVAVAPDRVLVSQLDVTNQGQIDRAVRSALDRWGRIDVLVNNAGRGEVGSVENTPAADVREIFEVLFFGPVAVIRAVLPHMRERKSGTIVQMSSMGGRVAYPGFSSYCAAKFALEGLSESLAAEAEPFGVRVLVVQPGAFRTEFSGAALKEGTWESEYESTVGVSRDFVKGIDGVQQGNPARAAERIFTLVNAQKAPLRFPIGNDAVEGIRAQLQNDLAEIDEYSHLAIGVGFEV